MAYSIWRQRGFARGLVISLGSDDVPYSDVMNLERQNLPEYRDRLLGFLGAVAIGGTVGHFLEWIRDRGTAQLELSVGFLVACCLCIVLSPNRYLVAFYSLSAIVVFGTVGAVLQRTVAGLPLILPCALLAFLLVRWKGKAIL
jgi:hypothetical protein